MEKRVAIFIFFLFVFNALSVFFIPIVHSGAVPSPTISFTEPTDVYIETNISHLVVNVSVTNGSNPVSTFIDWNKSLVAYYNFEEVGASTISDNSTHSYTGTYTGGIGDYDVIPSPRGFGMHFNGTSDYINCGLAGSEHYTEMTIEAWIMMSSTTPSGWRTALHRNDGTTVGSSVFFIGLESGTHNIVATIGAGSTGPTYTSGRTGVPAVPGVWYHVVNSWDGTTARVYINGTEMVSYALTSTNFVSKPGAVTMLGTSYSASGYSFHGGVDEVRIWNRSLSHDEINASHNSTVKNYLNRNFTDLENGNRSYYAHAINDGGGEATTGTQYVNVTLPYVDDWKPFSRVDNITTYEQNSAPITITATANDTGEGVKNVTLYYRHSIDNLTWAGGESNWWNTDWDYRKLITIDSSQITDTLTNFPILVHTDGDTSLLDNALANGSDITFIDWDDNTTQFNHEIESYYTGTLNAWVNITTLYHNKDKKLWMYYGNTSSLPQENVFGTWDGDFSQVLHLNETDIDNGIGDIKDSSNRFINATTKNMQTDDHIPGQVGGGMVFDGSNDYIDTAFTDGISSDSYTLNLWVNTIPTGSRYVVCQHDASYSSDFILGYNTGGFWGDSQNIQGNGIISTAGWHQLGFTMTTGAACTSKLYIDGKYMGTANGPVPPSLGDSIKIMARGDGAGSYCPGKVDEFRISNTIRNDSWIATEYATIKNQTTFISLGDEEGGGWTVYTNDTNPDLALPWSWSFTFPDATGYYEFYTVAYDNNNNLEDMPLVADTTCHYAPTTEEWNTMETLNGSIFNDTSFTSVKSHNGSLFNVSRFLQLNEINGGIFNLTEREFTVFEAWNSSLFNTSHVIKIEEINGTIYNLSNSIQVNIVNGTLFNFSSVIKVDSSNGQIYNNSNVIQIEDWSGELYNITTRVFNTFATLNGSIFNVSSTVVIEVYNYSLYNISNTIQIEDWNGSIFNSSSYTNIEYSNGYLYNTTSWISDDTLNGTLYNLTIGDYKEYSSWSGSLYNYSNWINTDTNNMSFYNTSNILEVDIMNGSIFNLSSIITIKNINGSIFNNSLWFTIEAWVGLLYNFTAREFNQYDNYNGSLFNNSISTRIETSNGSIFNRSALIQLNEINGSIFNYSNIIIVDLLNGSIFNTSVWNTESNVNGSLYNTSIFGISTTWNGTIYNFTVTTWNNIVIWEGTLYNSSNAVVITDTNGSIFNVSGISIIETKNGSLHNATMFSSLTTWNGSLYNVSVSKLITTWNGSIHNSSFTWKTIIIINGSFFNSTLFTQTEENNGSLYNSTTSIRIEEINCTIFNSSNWIELESWGGSLFGTNQSWLEIESWSGIISHVSLSINFTCETKGAWIECIACKEGRLDDYKWEIENQDGAVTGTTGWIDWDNEGKIELSHALSSEEWCNIFVYARNEWNETTQNSTSKSSDYTLPGLPPLEPDPAIPVTSVDIDKLPEAGTHRDDDIKLPGINFVINELVIVIIIGLIFVFTIRFYIRWKKEFK